MNDRRIELLPPARDVPTALAAIQCGADAVYLGAERFSACEAASNSVDAIRKVADFAHQYYAQVYVALNTLLYDSEMPLAEKLIGRLYQAGIDALIIQDARLLGLGLPPVPLIASTQMHNATVDRVRFWADAGFALECSPTRTGRAALGDTSSQPAEPLILRDEDSREYDVRFRCGPCGMEILLRRKEKTA